MPDIRCSSCGAALPPDAAFCLKCGARVSGTPVVEPADPLLAALKRALGGQYDIIRLLGRGGMGAVYLARERALDRLVAIKVLQPESNDPESVERFRREARTAAKLTHPGIVPLHTFGEAEGMMYFVMGFVQGEPLSAKLRRRGHLEAHEVREILRNVAEALQYAHDRGVVHRDIKPDNILIEDESGRPVLTDFGIAKSAGATGTTLTQLGTTLGTPHYMSPEQAAGDKTVDRRSDLYSLGVVGYQLLAGRLPFEGNNARDLMVQHITKEPPPLKAAAPSAPGDLVESISRLLTKDPAQRTADGRSLIQALQPSGGHDEPLPVELEELVHDMRAAPRMAAASLYVGYGCAVWGNWIGAAGSLLVAGLFALVPPITRRARKLQRYSWREILPRILRKPGWWSGWWPKRCRAPGDVWDRLPEPLRRVHELYLPLVAGFGLLLPFFARLMVAPTWPLIQMAPLLVMPFYAFFGVWGWRQLQFVKWGKTVGLSGRDISQLMGTGHGSPIWKKPHIEKLLLSPASSPALAAGRPPDTPAALVDALIEAARGLDGAARHLAEEAAAAGRDVLAAIQKLDGQIEALARDADPAERARVQEKVKALGGESEGQTDARRRMRRLLEEQLELARSLASQLKTAQERRGRLVELLRTLWLQIASLSAQQRDASFDTAAITGRIRAITQDAKRYLEASAEAAKLLE